MAWPMASPSMARLGMELTIQYLACKRLRQVYKLIVEAVLVGCLHGHPGGVVYLLRGILKDGGHFQLTVTHSRRQCAP